ncbi:hypothetical protein [Marinitoga litoralis]|uniref:hypothetical protein n=1 Tax=Marinitoga litoralis TaxID=570855 RepID=UPI001961748F|nr:hypothetical protein [Marinitoga litoralis]MBM7558445.1 hypothetical protein [Marinitoga litoralis]
MKKDYKKIFYSGLIIYVIIAALIWLLGPNLSKFPHLEDKGASWYYWKLPEPTFWGRITSWGGYIIHQITVWTLAFLAINKKEKRDKYLRLLFYSNIIFVVLHLIQTHLFYDGIAQDVPIWSSQYSVIVMLVLILFMLDNKRGMFFGKSIGIKKEYIENVKKWHGIYISWALIYTFWFHPMEGEIGLLIGFIYMFLLFIQASMIYTPIHYNLKWIAILETFVALHALSIALQKGQEVWPMFLIGFLFMFVMTYQYGLKMKKIMYLINWILYITLVIILYYFRGFNKLYELTFIPVALYGGVLLLLFVYTIIFKFIPKKDH